jgi:hypothetical protein
LEDTAFKPEIAMIKSQTRFESRSSSLLCKIDTTNGF